MVGNLVPNQRCWVGPLGGKGLLEVMRLKVATEGVDGGACTKIGWQRVPDNGCCNAEAARSENRTDKWHMKQVSGRRSQRTRRNVEVKGRAKITRFRKVYSAESNCCQLKLNAVIKWKPAKLESNVCNYAQTNEFTF